MKSSAKGGRSTFLSGVLVLTTSTVIVKVIGLIYKIPMLSYLGAEGMGYFNSAYEIYALLCVISTAGLPTALSMLVSSYRETGSIQRIREIYKKTLFLFLFLGVAGSVILLVFARQISLFIENENAFYCIVAISPALLCVCVSSAVRGYFQGYSYMYPTAISQFIEAIGKLVFGIIFAVFSINAGHPVPIVAAFAVAGLSLGTLLSSLYLLAVKASKGKSQNGVLAVTGKSIEASFESKGELKKLLMIALPITLSSAVISVTRIVDMALIMRRLQDIGYTSGVANEMYGVYTTIAVPIFSLIPSLLTPISLSLVPTLSSAIERRSERLQSDVIQMSVRLTVLFAMPSSLAIILYSRPIISILFPNAGEQIPFVATLLSLLGISVLFSCMITTTNSILQSYRKTTKPIASMAIGAIVKIITAYIFIGNPSINIYGAPISTFLCDFIITVINLYFIYKDAPARLKIWNDYIKPLIASCIAMLISLLAYIPIRNVLNSDKVAFLVAVPVAVISYFVISLLVRSITSEDILSLPMGEKILKTVNFRKAKKENKTL